MKSYYWIKLYHEILDDAKMGRLSDRLWRRAIELFLLAGEEHEGGHLPPIADMAWRLRLNGDELLDDLRSLAKVDIVTQLEDGSWFVTNFAERQGAMSNAERQKRYRDRKRKERYYGDGDGDDTKQSQGHNDIVTKHNTDIDIDKDIDEDIDRDVDVDVDVEIDNLNPFALYEQANGPLSPLVADKLGGLIDECERHRLGLPPPVNGSDMTGAEWVCAAIEEAAGSTNRFNLKYLQCIIDRWKCDGFETPRNGKGSQSTHAKTQEAIKEWEI